MPRYLRQLSVFESEKFGTIQFSYTVINVGGKKVTSHERLHGNFRIASINSLCNSYNTKSYFLAS
jgi:hypothetical protein